MMKLRSRYLLGLLAIVAASALYVEAVSANEPADSTGVMAQESDHQSAPQEDSTMSENDPAALAHFVLIYRHGPAYVDSLPAGAQPGIEGHFRHAESYIEELPGFMILGGPFLDNSGALMIFLVPSEREVRHFAESDPIVRSDLMEYSIHPWAVAVQSDSR